MGLSDIGKIIDGAVASVPDIIVDALAEREIYHDPLAGIKFEDKIEPDCIAEMNAVVKGFQENDAKRRAYYRQIFDTEYFVAVCFQSREQKEEFLAKSGLSQFGQDKYLDGRKVARHLGVELTPNNVSQRPLAVDTTFAEMAMEVE